MRDKKQNFNQRLVVFRLYLQKTLSLIIIQPKWLRYQIKRSFESYFPAFLIARDRKSLPAIALELCRLFIFWRCLPFHYFRYGLYRATIKPADIWNYLPETVFYYRLLPYTNPHMFLLDAKDIFARVAAGVGLPQPRTVLTVRKECIVDASGELVNSERRWNECLARAPYSLVLKPADGSGGREINFVEYRSGQHHFKNAIFDFALATCISRDDWILQERVVQDNTLRHIHPSSLNTLRILTCFRPRLGAASLFCMLKLGVSGRLTDNAHTEGIYCRVDPESGNADDYAYDENLNRYTTHPTSGVLISTIRVPQVREALLLATRCANLLPQLAFVGWDIACTPQGPFVLEGNSSPGLTIIQRTHGGMLSILAPYLDPSWNYR